MMDLLGVGNPYMPQRFAEGGDVQQKIGAINFNESQFAKDFPKEYDEIKQRAYESALFSLINNATRSFDSADEYVASVAASSGDVEDAQRRAYANAEKVFFQLLNANQRSLSRYGLSFPEQLRTVQGFREVFGPGFSHEMKEVGQKYFDEENRLRQDWASRTQGLSAVARAADPPKPEGIETPFDLITKRLGTYQPKPPPPTLVPSVPETPTTIPSLPVAQQIPAPVLPTPAPVISGNLTPQPMPGITAPPAPPPIGNIPQPSVGVLPQYQTPTYQVPSLMTPSSSPTAQAQAPQSQQPQTQIQYGPIGQGAVGQTTLLNTLLANQQDPTKVSLLGFDNPYLMKPFG